MRNIFRVIAVMLVMILVSSCTSKEINLSKSYNGDLFSFDYSSEWGLDEEESAVRIVSSGMMLQYGVVEDKNSSFRDIDSISSSLVEMMTGDQSVTSDKLESLPLKSEEDEETIPSRWIETRNDNGKGFIVFVPITGAVYVMQVSPGKYKAREFAEAKASCGTFKPIITEWKYEDVDQRQDNQQFDKFDNELWCMKYISDWEIEKTDNLIEFIDFDGVPALTVTDYPYPSANPSAPSSIVSWLDENCSDGYKASADMKVFTHTSIRSDDADGYSSYYMPLKGKVLVLSVHNSVEDDVMNEIIHSFTYFMDKDPGQIAREDGDNANDSNQDSNPDKTNGNQSVPKGEKTVTDTYVATLPAGWSFDEVSNLQSFVLPPGNSNSSFISIDVQDASTYSGIDNETMYSFYQEDPGMNVGEMKHVKLGDKDAVQFEINEEQTNQIVTIYIGETNFFNIKLMNEDGRYEMEYQKFIEWFKVD